MKNIEKLKTHCGDNELCGLYSLTNYLSYFIYYFSLTPLTGVSSMEVHQQYNRICDFYFLSSRV